MKKSFLPLTFAVACFILAACSSVKYEGESLPALSSDAPVKFYLASELDKMPGAVVLGTAEYTARPTLTSKDIRAILQDAARDEGANGIRIISMEKIPDGEARRNVSDNSDTSLSSMKNTINYSDVRDKEKTIYKTFVRAEFLSVPERETNVETRP